MSQADEPQYKPSDLRPLSDEKLIDLVASGRERRGGAWEVAEKAWRELAARHRDRLRGQVVAFRFPGKPDVRIAPADYEDATQECYIRAVKMLGNFRGVSRGEFLSALRTCVINTCMDFSRGTMRREKGIAGNIEEPASGEDDEALGRFGLDLAELAERTEASQTEARDELAALSAAIEKLPNEEMRKVLKRKMAGYSSKEIADELGLSVANVDQLTSRGIRKLQETMSDE